MSLISEVSQLDGLPEKASKHLKKEVIFLRSMSKVLDIFVGLKMFRSFFLQFFGSLDQSDISLDGPAGLLHVRVSKAIGYRIV